jgi:GNAT superfamily N-acetyltransferase
MNIEIEIMTGDAAWPRVKPLLDLAWPREDVEKLPWGHLTFAHADLRVIVEADEQPVCHVGLYRREGSWKGRKTKIGGIGGVTTHPDFRNQGFASVALNAAIHTFKEERATDFALLFCDPPWTSTAADRGSRSSARSSPSSMANACGSTR